MFQNEWSPYIHIRGFSQGISIDFMVERRLNIVFYLAVGSVLAISQHSLTTHGLVLIFHWGYSYCHTTSAVTVFDKLGHCDSFHPRRRKAYSPLKYWVIKIKVYDIINLWIWTCCNLMNLQYISTLEIMDWWLCYITLLPEEWN